MKGNDLVVHFVTETSWDQLPDEVQQVAHLALLDTLGAALAGTMTPISRITAEYAEQRWPGEEATVLFHGRRASAIGAAFANGYAANGIDIDDCGLYTKGHPGVQIMPTALALAEARSLSGAEMLTAIVVGYEGALRAAERALEAITEAPFDLAGRISASAGVSDMAAARSPSELVRLADEALLAAKHDGPGVVRRAM